MDLTFAAANGFVGFIQNLEGLVTRPYETFRRLVKNQNAWELLYIAILLAAYFATASIVKTAAFRPFLLTKQFVVLGSSVASMTLVVSYLFYAVARKFGAKGDYKPFAIAWAYTLIPTLLWFWITSILYIVLPPPRTTNPMGMIFSILYLTFSATLFYWKIILCYLSLRFALRMELKSILLTTLAAAIPVGGYCYLMYRLNIFRIPFI
jgi:hypothetical protein